MMHYGQQLSPFMGILISKGHQNINLKGGYFERALYRGSLLAFIKSGDYESRHRESGISNSAKLNPN